MRAPPRTPTAAVARPVAQQRFDDLGTPLRDVTFTVIDLETTGGSPQTCAITEVAALRYRGGELLRTFSTLVNPGVPIPPSIVVMTGITEAMVAPAPAIGELLPSILELIGDDGVVVGHNVRFDVAFLDAALERHGRPRLANRRVDTLALARRLMRDEVPDLKLHTLARHLRTSVRPTHRALDDARATVEVLHALLERAATLGVLGLDDLLALPTMRAHPSSAKLALTSDLPRTGGVYMFRDRDGRVLYVGKAANLRARVRSYFSSDDRRKVPQLLRETLHIDHLSCATDVESAVRELRLIQEHAPRFNRVARAGGRGYAYVKLTLGERFPRLAVVRDAPCDGSAYLGPLPSRRAARAVKEAIETAVPLRRCTSRIGRRSAVTPDGPCPPAQLGVALCPCRGHVDEAAYAAVVESAVEGITRDPRLLLAPLEDRMARYANAARFEEAAATRERLAELSRALSRQRLATSLQRAGLMRLDLTGGGTALIDRGRLVLDDADDGARGGARGGDLTGDDGPPRRDEIDEILLLARWLVRASAERRVRLLEVTGRFESPAVRLPSYEPARSPAHGSRALRRPRPAGGTDPGATGPPSVPEVFGDLHETGGEQRPDGDQRPQP